MFQELFRVPYYNNTCMSSVLTQDHSDYNRLCVKIVCWMSSCRKDDLLKTNAYSLYIYSQKSPVITPEKQYLFVFNIPPVFKQKLRPWGIEVKNSTMYVLILWNMLYANIKLGPKNYRSCHGELNMFQMLWTNTDLDCKRLP